MAPRRQARRAPGFTFVALLFVIALMGITAAAAGVTWRFVVQREREEQLVFAGLAYRDAIARYAADHARDAQPWPTTLAQLLGDERALAPRRWLRRLYLDPMTGAADWVPVRTPDGGIVGVHSRSTLRPVRTRARPGEEGIAFSEAKTYREWVFGAQAVLERAPAAPAAPGARPGWNYLRDGEPPPTWEGAAPPAPVEPVGPS